MVRSSPSVARAVQHLERGLTVAAATETVFGLLADATSSAALDELGRIKPRGNEKGIGLLLPTREAWDDLVVEIPDLAAALAAAFWPGPLTIALEARRGVDLRLVYEGTIAVRLAPPSPAALIATAFGRPLTATSANPPGVTPASTPVAVRRAFPEAVREGRLEVVLGDAPGGAPSTVVTVSGAELRIAREGAISAREIDIVAAPFRR
jgi:L-threonylcarbamoyladenylate synthase